MTTRRRTPARDRLYRRVNKKGPMSALGTRCWLWTGYVGADGYGQIADDNQVLKRTHILAFELEHGSTPPGVQHDHLCHNADTTCEGVCRHRACVRPDHIERVNNQTNSSRGRAGHARGRQQRAKTHCPQGHPYDDNNTYISKKGKRECRECHREATRRWRAGRR